MLCKVIEVDERIKSVAKENECEREKDLGKSTLEKGCVRRRVRSIHEESVMIWMSIKKRVAKCKEQIDYPIGSGVHIKMTE